MADSERTTSSKDPGVNDAGQLRQTTTSTRVRTHRLATQSQKRHVPTSYFASESLILAFLFTLIVLSVPSLFYHISKRVLDEKQASNTTSPSVELSGDETAKPNDALQPFLVLVLSYIPRVSVVVAYLYRFALAITYPVVLLIYFLISVFQPVLILLRLILQGFIVVPFRALVTIVDFLYPIYVFVGVACLAGGLVGLCATTVIHSLKLLFT